MNDGEENLKQKNAGSPIFILVIFVALIAFLFFVPEIYKKYNKEISDFLGGFNKPEESEKKSEDEKPAISDYYQLGSRGTLSFNEITLTDISLSEDNTLTFTVQTDGTFDLSEAHYYLEFYEERRTFLGRRVLKGKVSKEKEFSLDVSNMPVTTVTFMTVSYIEDEGIPPLKDTSGEDGLSNISCSKGDETYEYEFKDKKLNKLIYKYNYQTDDADEFASVLLKIEKKENQYNEFTGVTANTTTSENSLIFISEFDFEENPSFKRLGDEFVFERDTLDKMVKFKMEAEGFDCK